MNEANVVMTDETHESPERGEINSSPARELQPGYMGRDQLRQGSFGAGGAEICVETILGEEVGEIHRNSFGAAGR